MVKQTSSIVKFPSELETLGKFIPGVIDVNYDIQTLTVASEFGLGHVRYTRLQNGLQAYDFNFRLVDDLEIPVCSITEASLHFIYCLDGHFRHQFNEFDEVNKIEQFQTAVIHSIQGITSNILIKKDTLLVLNMICVDKKDYFDQFCAENNLFNNKIRALLSKIKKQSKHFHLGNYNLKIAEQFKLLFGIEYSNEVSELLSQKGRYYIILAKHIEQFHAEIENSSNTSGLLKDELKSISELSDHIKNNPEFQHSIKSLCQLSGLSPAKLQEGFRFMFDRTVSDFVRHIRLEKAEMLIKTTDLTISEIVYSIGLTSRSYFCKIFKRKNSCSPMEYKNGKSG